MKANQKVDWEALPEADWALPNRTLARKLGIDPSTVRAARNRHDANGGTIRPVPDGYALGKITTQTDAAGNVVQRWIRSSPDDAENRILDIVRALCEPHEGSVDPRQPPAYTDDDLLSVYLFGDPHFGMYADPDETGNAWSLRIASAVHHSAATDLIARAPASRKGVVVLLGDNVHANDNTARTPASGHALDVDDRWHRVLPETAKAVHAMVQAALEKHAEVDVYVLAGNHDPTAAMSIAITLWALYMREPRVMVDTSPRIARAFLWGRNLIAMAHGHTRRMKDLGGVAPRLWPELWGESTHRAWYTGHVHHEHGLTLSDGSRAESLETLAARDAYAAGGMWSGGRSARLDVWHRERGCVEKHYHRIE